ncbi:MAG: hypothetical protein AMK75_01850 [Planctomycetes bacterium SM23_65]|nr:MAG: hypothetical protein AMK75_01850 [Planctomycetes bacterium SM23_65]
MRVVSGMILVLWLVSGCAQPPAPPQELPPVASRDYDLLWQATLNVVEEHFELWVKRKEDGYIISTYKRGEPLPDEYARDAQTGYHAAEEFLHIVRRRLTGRVLEDYPGVYRLHLEIIRERQGYLPPSREYSSSYSLYEPRKSMLNEAADQGPTVTWYRLGRDLHLEKELLRRVQVYLNRHARG